MKKLWKGMFMTPHLWESIYMAHRAGYDGCGAMILPRGGKGPLHELLAEPGLWSRVQTALDETGLFLDGIGNCIIDDQVCRDASAQEIIRRYYRCLCDRKRYGQSKDDKNKLELLLRQAGVSMEDRLVAKKALAREEETGHPAMAIELADGTIVTGKTGDLLGASAAAILNALKVLAGIPHEVQLVSKEAIEPIQRLKIQYLGSHNPRLHTDEILIALSTTAAQDEKAKLAIEQLSKLKNCQAHSTVLLSSVDEQLLKKIGVQLTCSPKYEEEDRKYHRR